MNHNQLSKTREGGNRQGLGPYQGGQRGEPTGLQDRLLQPALDRRSGERGIYNRLAGERGLYDGHSERRRLYDGPGRLDDRHGELPGGLYDGPGGLYDRGGLYNEPASRERELADEIASYLENNEEPPPLQPNDSMYI